jgi:hypothetical protein
MLDPDPGQAYVSGRFRSTQLGPKLGAGLVQVELERASDDLTPKVADQRRSGSLSDVDRGRQQPLPFGVSDPLYKPALLGTPDLSHGNLPVVNHNRRPLARTGAS